MIVGELIVGELLGVFCGIVWEGLGDLIDLVGVDVIVGDVLFFVLVGFVVRVGVGVGLVVSMIVELFLMIVMV